MSAGRLTADGKLTRLDARAGAPEVLTKKDVEDTDNLATVLNDLRADVAEERSNFRPSRLDFEDFPVSGGGFALRLNHGFGGRVRWYVVDWQSSGTSAPILKNDTTQTDMTTLVLLSYVAGTVTVRVEAAG